VFRAIDIAFAAALLLLALVTAGHALIYKREPRAATLWVVVICALPGVGALLYLLLGINRVVRRATGLRRAMVRHRAATELAGCEPEGHLLPLARLVGQVAGRPLLPGNAVDPLIDGAQAYPAMLEAIDAARTSIGLASYIFDAGGIGAEFVAALARAAKRGVAVRVLVDDVDVRFSLSPVVKPLARAGVPVGVFNPPLLPARLHAMNLRNHRKILLIDGTLGFTGGMNIDQRYWRPGREREAFRDLHFRLRGPVVAQLAEVFASDWQFTTGEALRGHAWFAQHAGSAGPTAARGIEAGPDESFERLRWAIIGGVNAAERTVRILTPYFLPDATLVSALDAAALRGVEVDIVLPRNSDLPHVQWAVFGQLWQVLDHGCRVWLSPGPFDHSKLLVVDGAWTLLGSANWDARSLRLNFELGVECYCRELGARLGRLIEERRSAARPLTLREIDARSLPVKLRDGAARLFAPYL
jgi:cardiolipin synthase